MQLGTFGIISPPGNGGIVDIDNFNPGDYCKPCIVDSIQDYNNQIVALGGDNLYTATVEESVNTTQLLQKQRALEAWINFGIYYGIESKDYGFAQSIIENMKPWKWQSKTYGLDILKGDLEAAKQRLQTIPVTNTDESYFKTTQEVNLKVLEGLSKENQITAADLTDLELIGTSDYPSSGYARALYFMLTRKQLPYDKTLLMEAMAAKPNATTYEEEGTESGGIATTKPIDVTIFPNPAKDVIQVNSNNNVMVEQVTLSNHLGQTVLKKYLGNSEGRIDVSTLESGIYFILVAMNNGEVVSKKIFINH